MKRMIFVFALLFSVLIAGASPAAATQRFIVRTTSLPLLQKACLLNLCNVVNNLDGTINQGIPSDISRWEASKPTCFSIFCALSQELRTSRSTYCKTSASVKSRRTEFLQG